MRVLWFKDIKLSFIPFNESFGIPFIWKLKTFKNQVELDLKFNVITS